MRLQCPHRPPCPGCPRLDGPDTPHATLTRLNELASDVSLPAPAVIRGRDTAFRYRARLAVRGRLRSPKIGIFQAGSHRVVDTPDCLIHHPLVNTVARVVRDAMKETSTPPYSDEAHEGVVRYLQVTVERASQTAQVVLVTRDETPEPVRPLFRVLRRELGDRLHGLYWNGNPERTNRILGEKFHRFAGREAVQDIVDGTPVFFPPGAFMQSHLELAAVMVRRVRQLVPDAARVVEFYAGTGSFGLGLLDRAESVCFNEAQPDGIRGLHLGLQARGEARHRARIVPGPAADAAALVDDADAVLVDPPRKGLDRALLERLCKKPPARLLYVACGVDSFLRDARALLDTGRARLRLLEAYDLFPHTDHVEAVAVFEAG